MSKLINIIPGSRLLISSLPGSALRTHVESLGKPRDVNMRSQALPDKLDIKRHSPSILYLPSLLLQDWDASNAFSILLSTICSCLNSLKALIDQINKKQHKIMKS